MNRLARGGRRGGDHVRDPEIAVGRGRRANADCGVCHAHVQRVAIGGGIDGDRLDVELVECPNHTHRDLPPVGDEDAGEHRQTIG